MLLVEAFLLQSSVWGCDYHSAGSHRRISMKEKFYNLFLKWWMAIINNNFLFNFVYMYVCVCKDTQQSSADETKWWNIVWKFVNFRSAGSILLPFLGAEMNEKQHEFCCSIINPYHHLELLIFLRRSTIGRIPRMRHAQNLSFPIASYPVGDNKSAKPCSQDVAREASRATLSGKLLI